MIFLLNLPWTLLGIFLALISGPKSLQSRDGAIIIRIQSWWWSNLVWWLRGVRGLASGDVVVLGPNQEPRDLEHELVHVQQHRRFPLIFPFLYTIESLRFGYRKNRFKEEAYRRAGNIYHT